MKLTLLETHKYYFHVHCESLQALQAYQSRQDSYCVGLYHNTTYNPFSQRYDCSYFTVVVVNIYCLAVFVFGDFFGFFLAKQAKISCKGRATGAKLFCFSTIPIQSV